MFDHDHVLRDEGDDEETKAAEPVEGVEAGNYGKDPDLDLARVGDDEGIADDEIL